MVGVVKHEVLWYPRPFWTRATPLLDGWKPTFVVTGDIGPTVTSASDDDGSMGWGVRLKKETSGALTPDETCGELRG